MELVDVLELCEFWARSPPPDILLEILARLWGWKPPAPDVPQMTFEDAIAAQGDTFKIPRRWFN